MKIIDALKDNVLKDIRLKHGNRWMFWDDIYGAWTVIEERPYARSGREIITTEDEDEAVAYLLSETYP